MKLIPIRECGGGREGTLSATYKEIVNKVGEPNVTDLDDTDKVKASWGFHDEDGGNNGFIWCYKWYGKPYTCTYWSIDGISLLQELFESKVTDERLSV